MDLQITSRELVNKAYKAKFEKFLYEKGSITHLLIIDII